MDPPTVDLQAAFVLLGCPGTYRFFLITNDPLESFDLRESRVPANIFLQWIHASTRQLAQEVVCTEENTEKSLTGFELEVA